MKLTEKTLSKEYKFNGKIINLRVDTALLPDGKTAAREVVEHRGGVCVLPLTDKNEILMVRQFRYPYMEELIEIPAGKRDSFEEEPLACGKRELKEETGLDGAYMEQFHTFSAPERDPRERVITIAYYALVKIQEVKGGDDAASARWFPLDDIPSLAFDHDYILRMATQRLREQIHFQPIGFELLPEKFTLKELQLLYEAILGINFDRRNFSKKMLHLEILTDLEETVWPTPKREAKLYKFNAEKYEELKRKGFRLEF
jgi:8-oxo-dGTP diphosphatase